MNTDGTRQFIVTLPSNASDDKYKQNRPSNYKTELSRPLELSDEWEVALVDIQYPLNWNNFTERTSIVMCFKTDNSDREIVVTTENSVPYRLPTGYPKADSTSRDHWKNAVIALTKNKFTAVPVYTQPLYYSSVQQFGEHLASLLTEKAKTMSHTKVTVSYVMDPLTEIGELSTNIVDDKLQKLFFLTDNQYAMRVLGYEPSQKLGTGTTSDPFLYQYTFKGLATKETFDAPVKGRLDRPFSIYVYSDIVKPQLVGDVHAPLLGVVPVFRGASATTAAASKTGSDSLGYWSFNPTYYLPLRFHRFDTIDVVLCTDEGVELKFEDEDRCKVVCRLHFQKRSAAPL